MRKRLVKKRAQQNFESWPGTLLTFFLVLLLPSSWLKLDFDRSWSKLAFSIKRFQVVNFLTSLQLFTQGKPELIFVGTGNDLKNIFDKGRASVSRVVIHPHFNGTLENNIALLQLAKPLNFNSSALPGCLDTQNVRKNYGDLVAIGFGFTSKLVIDQFGLPLNSPSYSRFLKEVDYQDISESEDRCQSNPNLICTNSKSKKVNESICFGDGGKFF